MQLNYKKGEKKMYLYDYLIEVTKNSSVCKKCATSNGHGCPYAFDCILNDFEAFEERKGSGKEFEIKDTFYISESDLNKMVKLRAEGCSLGRAISEVASYWSDEDFCKVGMIEDALMEEIDKRVSQLEVKSKFMPI